MKKAIVLLLMAAMMTAFAACGGGAETSSVAETTAPAATEAPSEEETEAETEAESESESADEPQGDSNAASGDTVAQTLLQDFKDRVAADPAANTQTLADGLLTNSVIQFSGATMPVEPGLLTGFGNAEITGFKEGTMFAPMIGSIAFVGYVFELEEGADAAAFISTLETNADPRWNICVEAEETVVEQAENKVFFVMSPKSMTE
ncbi:MAG: hypothetical protein E7511_01670 [Ruminococcus sp.]|nr:hypothetical protein [Ruminococcus sp.]